MTSSSTTTASRPRPFWPGLVSSRSGGRAGSAVPSGSSMLKVAPSPGFERASTRWPSRFAMRRTMAKPRPRPWLRSRARLPTWWNSSKIRSRWSGGMPMPVSSTSMRSRSLDPAAGEPDVSGHGIAHGVLDQVPEHASEQRPVAAHPVRAGFDPPVQTLGRCYRSVAGGDLIQYRGDREFGDFRRLPCRHPASTRQADCRATPSAHPAQPPGASGPARLAAPWT